MSYSVLIIDDEATLAKNIETYLKRHGYDARVALTGEAGLSELDRFRPDVVLLDIQLTTMNGLDVLKEIRAIDTQVKVIMMTGHGGVQIAVDAMKAGAYDYLSKPLVLKELKLLLDKTVGHEQLEGALAYYQARQAKQSGLAKILGESAPIVSLKRKVIQLIDAERQLTDAESPSVLITGETGTGKELVARAFHFDGPRAERPFIEINCSAIPGHLLEAELFGYERGAFTDAKGRKQGLMETADGGTLFLDEIGEMEISVQAKLLKVLEGKTVRRLGSVREHKVEARIIAASNRDLEERIRSGKFRRDLFFRLRVLHIELPPLCERAGDVTLLANNFLSEQGKRYGKRDLRFAPEAEQLLLNYTWPGNVRELRNVIEQAVLLTRSDIIDATHLALCPALTQPEQDGAHTLLSSKGLPEGGVDLQQVEKDLIIQALDQTAWNITQAAKLLGLSRDTLRYRMEKQAPRHTISRMIPISLAVGTPVPPPRPGCASRTHRTYKSYNIPERMKTRVEY